MPSTSSTLWPPNEQRRQVLHVTWPTDGGAARCVHEYARDQMRRGWRVTIACPADGWLPKEVLHLGASLVTWNAVRDPSPKTISEALALRRIAHELRPDIVHLHSSKAGLAGRLAIRSSLPTIFQPHAWSFEATKGHARLLSVLWERSAARWTDVTICVSRSEMRRGLEAGIRGRYRVVTNGVDLSTWREAGPDEKRAARQRLELGDVPTVVCVGRLSIQKGQDVLLEAWREILPAMPSARLILVGDGPEGQSLRSRPIANVTFVGDRTDVAEWLAAADVVAIPSRWEGMPLVLLEAMARGRSIVATDAPGVREGLRDRTGAVVGIGRAHDLAREVLARLRNPDLIRSEGRAARKVAEQQHNLGKTLERLTSVYEEVLDLRRHPAGISSRSFTRSLHG